MKKLLGYLVIGICVLIGVAFGELAGLMVFGGFPSEVGETEK